MPNLDDLIRIFILNEEPKEPQIATSQLINTSTESIYSLIAQNGSNESSITTNNIPQFSSFEVVFDVLKIVNGSPEENMNWEKLGYYLCPKNAKRGAKTKYGENHYKLAVQLGLAMPSKKLALTELGTCINTLDYTDKFKCASLLSLRIPIIQTALLHAKDNRFDIFDYLKNFLSESTIIRRRSNIKKLLSLIENYSTTEDMKKNIWNIVWDKQRYELP